MSTEPIERSIHVTASPEEAFRIFTAEMTTWWPLQTHTRGDEEIKTERVVVEERTGGRVYEVMSDGSEGDWGVVRVWEPARRLVLDWKPNDEDRPYTEVEVLFEPADGGGATVSLTHRGWELLGPVADEARAEYGTGWVHVFDDRFGAAAGRPA
jgi:uncharacterized protein YndB with AHSA1/START domain